MLIEPLRIEGSVYARLVLMTNPVFFMAFQDMQFPDIEYLLFQWNPSSYSRDYCRSVLDYQVDLSRYSQHYFDFFLLNVQLEHLLKPLLSFRFVDFVAFKGEIHVRPD